MSVIGALFQSRRPLAIRQPQRARGLHHRRRPAHPDQPAQAPAGYRGTDESRANLANTFFTIVEKMANLWQSYQWQPVLLGAGTLLLYLFLQKKIPPCQPSPSA